MSKYVGLQMRAFNQAGSIINISSVTGHQRTYSSGSLAYASSKSALNTMIKVHPPFSQLYSHQDHILGSFKHQKVNSICPGFYQSEITEGLMRKKGLKQLISKLVPLGNFGTIDPALTSLVRYLIYDTSDYVTGNIFIVDAGHTLIGVPIYLSL
ncbi:putative short-chain dehydrogenase/reductase SDR, NAD(P)-binding domain superfamily [Helianthus anomalus]